MEDLLNKVALGGTFALQLLILFLLMKRRLRRRFFWFLAYIIFELLESAVRFSVPTNSPRYDTIFWWTEIGDVTLMVLAFRESFLNTFQEYTRLRWFMSIVWGCIGAALLYALFKALVFPPVQATRRGAIIIGLEVAINFTLGVVGGLYFALAGFFKIMGRQWESGIISGFTIYVSFGICGFLILSIFGLRFETLNKWLSPIGYILAEATWVLELGRQERAVAIPSREVAIDQLTESEQYIRLLERFLRRKA